MGFGGREQGSSVGTASGDELSQVRIFLSWVQYVVDFVVQGRLHVFVNVDETALASVRHRGWGMASLHRRSVASPKARPRDPLDRGFSCTTLVAVVCDCPSLQPLLPQIILSRYTQNAALPAARQAQNRACGFPFEFWNGTAGRMTPTIFRNWATRLRQAVGSFNPGAWIVLILDCSTCHLDRASVVHMRRLGFIVIFIPAKMTWLLQLLDVYIFLRLKRGIREAEARFRSRTSSGQIPSGAWLKLVTTIIRREIVNCDWSHHFSRVGLGESCHHLSRHLAELIDPASIRPALPTRAEFALLVGRSADTVITRTLHASILGHTLAVQRLPAHAQPPHSATYVLPVSADARPPSSRRETYEAMEVTEVIDAFAQAAPPEPDFLHPFVDARNLQVHGERVVAD